MSTGWIALILFAVALLVTLGVFPYVLRFARKHQLVDNPNARKLQRVPVPVIGGTAVFMGILAAMVVAIFVFDFHFLWVGLATMAVMWMIGTWDDIKDIPALFRFVVEMFLMWAMISISKTGIDDFHGLWGLGELSLYLSLPLSIIAGVGIINALNLMDGVDGYCSGFGIVSSILFGMFFFHSGDPAMGCFSLICAGSLIPFFLHNVFGSSSKMFIGDGGSLMIGAALTIIVFNILSKDSSCVDFADQGMGLIPFTLAVLSIPVFDTLRVMSARVMRGMSPFHPDKTHLHHLFIEMGFSHVGTSFTIILVDLLIVVIWFVSYLLGASIDWQFYIVLIASILVTFVFYRFMKEQQRANDGDGTQLYQWFCKWGSRTHLERQGIWQWMRNLVDKILVNEK